MKNLLFLLFVAMLSCKTLDTENAKPVEFYLGTYTDGESKGIYKYSIDKDGKLTKIGLLTATNNPSFLTKTKDNSTLIAVDETNKNGTGFVKSYSIKEDTLIFKSKSKSGGAHPCFITVNDKNQVLVANYTGGNIGYLKLDNQKGLTNLLAIQQHYGKGTTDRQKSPHAHSVWFHPNTNEIISVDLGTNELWFSTINKEDKFVSSKQVKFKMNDGAGPRHLTFHPDKAWIYTLNELNNSVSLIKKNDGVYSIDQSIETLPKDFDKYSKGADIHISKDGKFLYASNRGHESIVIYKVNSKNGKLSLVGFQNVRGAHPRNFALTPNNKYLVVANQDTNNLVAFSRNEKTGKLTFVSEIEAPKPVCILF